MRGAGGNAGKTPRSTLSQPGVALVSQCNARDTRNPSNTSRPIRVDATVCMCMHISLVYMCIIEFDTSVPNIALPQTHRTVVPRSAPVDHRVAIDRFIQP